MLARSSRECMVCSWAQRCQKSRQKPSRKRRRFTRGSSPLEQTTPQMARFREHVLTSPRFWTGRQAGRAMQRSPDARNLGFHTASAQCGRSPSVWRAQSPCMRSDATGPLLPFGYATALLRSGQSSLPQQNRPGSVGDADEAAFQSERANVRLHGARLIELFHL